MDLQDAPDVAPSPVKVGVLDDDGARWSTVGGLGMDDGGDGVPVMQRRQSSEFSDRHFTWDSASELSTARDVAQDEHAAGVFLAMLELARDAGAGVLTCSCARPRKPPRDEAAEPLRDDRTAAEKQVDQHLENAAIRIQARSRGSHDRRVVGERIVALEQSRAWSTASSFDEFVAAKGHAWNGPPAGAFG